MSAKRKHDQVFVDYIDEARIAESVEKIDPKKIKFREMGYREIDGHVFGPWNIRGPCGLHRDDFDKMIEAAGIPIPGWTDRGNTDKLWESLHQEFLSIQAAKRSHSSKSIDTPEPIQKQGAAPISARDMIEAIQVSNLIFQALRDKLIGVSSERMERHWFRGKNYIKKAYDHLKKQESYALFEKDEAVEEFDRTLKDLKKISDRCEYYAYLSQRGPQQEKALITVVGSLSHSYKKIFGKEAGAGMNVKRPGHSKDGDEEDGPVNIADSPFIRFAKTFLDSVGYPVTPLTIRSALRDYRKMKKSS